MHARSQHGAERSLLILGSATRSFSQLPVRTVKPPQLHHEQQRCSIEAVRLSRSSSSVCGNRSAAGLSSRPWALSDRSGNKTRRLTSLTTARHINFRCSKPNTSRGFATVTDVDQDRSSHQSKYAAVVVGAGPAGITVIGNLLERKCTPVLWVDGHFNGGRVNEYYREVPSNTKTKLFIDFAEAVSPFRKIIDDTPSPNAIDNMRSMQQDKGCHLGHAADMLLMLTKGLTQTPGIEVHKGRVTSATHDSARGWSIDLSPDPSNSSTNKPSRVVSSRLMLCTGSSPSTRPLPVSLPNTKSIDLDVALSPTNLRRAIPSDVPQTIAVIGASHSAILVLLNLSKLAQTTHPLLKIRWFTRHALRYAEFMDGWILRDNTGLKGEAAEWARANLEPESWKTSPVKSFLTPWSYSRDEEEKVLKEGLLGCDVVVQAVGYARDPIPLLKRGEGSVEGKGREEVIRPFYDHQSGAFDEGRSGGPRIPGLFGAGIAWPERVTDPQGNVEYAVGFWKFMRYIKKVSGEWTQGVK